MGPSVIAGVLTVVVADHRGREQRVVERGVEGHLRVPGTATDADAAEQAVPPAGARSLDPGQGPTGIFGPDVGGGIGGADEGDADLHENGPLCLRIEGHEGAAGRPRTRGGSRRDGGALPAARRGEWSTELGREVQGVVRAGATELTTGDLAGDRVLADQMKARRGDRVGAPRHLEQEIRLIGGRKRHLGEPRPGRDRQLRRHRRGAECDLVATGRGVLAGVGERGGRCLRCAADRAHRRQDRHVAVGSTADPAQIGQTEAGNGGVGIGVAAPGHGHVGRGVRAPLDHPERQVGAGELTNGTRVDRPGPRSGHWIDQTARVADQCGDARRSVSRHQRASHGFARHQDHAGEPGGQNSPDPSAHRHGSPFRATVAEWA